MQEQVEIIGMRFNEQKELALYKKEGALKGSFKFPLLKGKLQDKSIKQVLAGICEGELKGTVVIVYRKNDNGFMEYCIESEGKAKGVWGGEQTAEVKAFTVQEQDEADMSDAEIAIKRKREAEAANKN